MFRFKTFSHRTKTAKKQIINKQKYFQSIVTHNLWIYILMVIPRNHYQFSHQFRICLIFSQLKKFLQMVQIAVSKLIIVKLFEKVQ